MAAIRATVIRLERTQKRPVNGLQAAFSSQLVLILALMRQAFKFLHIGIVIALQGLQQAAEIRR